MNRSCTLVVIAFVLLMMLPIAVGDRVAGEAGALAFLAVWSLLLVLYVARWHSRPCPLALVEKLAAKLDPTAPGREAEGREFDRKGIMALLAFVYLFLACFFGSQGLKVFWAGTLAIGLLTVMAYILLVPGPFWEIKYGRRDGGRSSDDDEAGAQRRS